MALVFGIKDVLTLTISTVAQFIEKASCAVHGAVHNRLEPLTDDIQMVETSHPKDGHLVMFLDTPTFGDHSYSSTDVLYQIAQWLKQQ
jgi:hypothetical protein